MTDALIKQIFSSMIKLRVKELLRERGKTQKDLSDRLGMSEVGFSKTIGEDGNPSLKRLEEIAVALGVSIPELFEQPQKDEITGFVKVKGELKEIKSVKDLRDILDKLEH